MKTRIVRIGNSHGIRIPKPLLEQTGLQGEVELEVQGNQLLVRSIDRPRQGWEAKFRDMAERNDDALLDSEAASTAWEDEDWEW